MIHFDYKEFNPQEQLLNHEEGPLIGVLSGLTTQMGPIHLLTQLSYFSNQVDYQGQTQSGTTIQTQTDEKLWALSLQLAKSWQLKKVIHYQLYMGLNYDQWQREIHPTTAALGLLETYEWWSGQVGIKSFWPISEKWHWMMDLSLLYPFQSQITIDFNGIFDTQTLSLNQSIGHRLSFAWHYQFSRPIKIALEPYLEYQPFNQSSTEPLTRHGKTVGRIFEPKSRMLNYGFSFNLTYCF